MRFQLRLRMLDYCIDGSVPRNCQMDCISKFTCLWSLTHVKVGTEERWIGEVHSSKRFQRRASLDYVVVEPFAIFSSVDDDILAEIDSARMTVTTGAFTRIGDRRCILSEGRQKRSTFGVCRTARWNSCRCSIHRCGCWCRNCGIYGSGTRLGGMSRGVHTLYSNGSFGWYVLFPDAGTSDLPGMHGQYG